MYEARKISNFILANYDARRFDITNLRLNKLLYFIHAESLSTLPDGLVRNHFEAWEYGPVIRPVFDSFKRYGDRWISAPAYYLDYATGEQAPVPHEDIAPEHASIISRVFESYSEFSTSKLVALSHERGGPWDVVFQAHLSDPKVSPRIPTELIRDYFIKGEVGAEKKH